MRRRAAARAIAHALALAALAGASACSGQESAARSPQRASSASSAARSSTPGAPRIAAAANLNFVLTEIANRFASERGQRVELVFGSSGTLARQIHDGAPFDMFLAADEEFPRRIAAGGLTRDDGVVYAVGRLALFAPTGSPLAVDAQLQGLARLVKDGQVSRFAIANPDVAPYGAAAEAVLRKRGLWDAIRPRLVLGDTIAQAAQFASTGNAVGGLIAYSVVLAPGFGSRGTHAVIPDGDYPPLRQRMVLMRTASAPAADFYEYVLGDTARAMFEKYGYGTSR